MVDAVFRIWQAAGVRVVAAAGPLDFAASVRLRLVLFDQIDDGARDLAVDIADVDLLDASAVGVLLRIAAEVGDCGGRLRVVGATDLPLAVLEVTGAAGALAVDGPPPQGGVEAGRGAGARGWGDRINNLLFQLSQLPSDDRRRGALRGEVVEACLPHVRRLARRFSGLGEPDDDLEQVAAVGLLHAVNRYDPALVIDFASFAVPTIMGELKRHFRDHGWSVHVPRRLRELRPEISWAREVLAQRDNRSATTRDVAAFLGLDEREVTRAVVAGNGYRATPLATVRGADEASLDQLGIEDAGIEAVDRHHTLQSLLRTLPARERRIVALRFYGDRTQCEIARELGMSQMHVSRLLSRSLSRLRDRLDQD